MALNLSCLDTADFIEIDTFHQYSSAARHTFSLSGTPRKEHGFCCILSGAFYYEENGSTLKAEAGDIVYLKQGTQYTVTSCKTSELAADILLNFRVRGAFPFADWNTVTAHDGNGALTAEFEQLAKLCSRDASLLEKKECFYRILCAFVPPEQIPDERISQVRHRLDDPACRDGDAELAALCAVSVSTLQRRFLATYGKTIREYRSMVKIAAAKEFLLRGQYTIAGIADFLGYYDASYFCKQFKKATGVTPRAYLSEKRKF